MPVYLSLLVKNICITGCSTDTLAAQLKIQLSVFSDQVCISESKRLIEMTDV